MKWSKHKNAERMAFPNEQLWYHCEIMSRLIMAALCHLLPGCRLSLFRVALQALGKKAPVNFPVDPGMMPGVRSRVKLAVRLDNAVRSGSKKKAEDKWRAAAAQELDIDLSDDELRNEDGSASKPVATAKVVAMQKVGPSELSPHADTEVKRAQNQFRGALMGREISAACD